MPKKDRAEKLNKLLEFLNEPTSKEFTAAFGRVLTLFKEQFRKMKEDISAAKEQAINEIDNKISKEKQELNRLQQEFSQVISQAKRESDSTFSGIKRNVFETVSRLFARSKIDKKFKQKMKEIDDRLLQIRDGIDGKDADEERIISEATRMALETLNAQKDTRGLKKLKKQIRGILKQLKELKKERQKVIYTGGSSPKFGGHVQYYDLSASLDGSTRTFALPAFARVLSVQSSSFPNAFRPSTDYTTDASAMTITFTSEIDAATTLAAGQTIIILYATQ